MSPRIRQPREKGNRQSEPDNCPNLLPGGRL